jgi:hypothetical protein
LFDCVLILRFLMLFFDGFVLLKKKKLEPDANEGKTEAAKRRRSGSGSWKARRAGFRRDSENLHVGLRHWRLHHVVVAA